MALIPLNTFKTKTKNVPSFSTTTATVTAYVAPIGVTSIVLMAQVANISTVTQTVNVVHYRNRPVLRDAQGNGAQDGSTPTYLVKDYAIPAGDAGSVLAGKFVGGAPVGVENKQTAILVQYGSSSFANTFYVSSSGDMRAYGSISGSKIYSYGSIKVDNGSYISKTDSAIITGSFKGNYQKDQTTVSAPIAAATTNLSFDDYDMIYLTATAAQTFNVNLTQKKVCYLYFYNNSGGTSFIWQTGTTNSLKWPSATALNPSNGSRDLYSIILMGSEILINRIAASYNS
jgi:hypothetical protein